MKITIEGQQHKVVEHLGVQAGYVAKVVETQAGEKVAVKRGGEWRFWNANDRLGIPSETTAQQENTKCT